MMVENEIEYVELKQAAIIVIKFEFKLMLFWFMGPSELNRK